MSKFQLNEEIIVQEPKGSDLWNHSFKGTIVSIKEKTYVVEDQDGNIFEVEKERVEKE